MELRHLRYFLAVAETCHFRRASEALYVSQPTLSLQVQQLEQELGADLFERVGRRVRLTPAGELFRDHARRVLKELEDARAGLDELGGLKRGRVAVGVVQTVNADLVPTAAARFSAAYPGVALRVDQLSADAVEAGVADGTLDLGVSFTPPTDERVESSPLFDEELVLIVPASHRWASRARVRAADLDGEPLGLLPRGFSTRRIVDESLRAAGVAPRAAVEMNSVAGLVALVARGGPATILPALAAAGDRPSVSRVRITDPTPRRSVGLLTRLGSRPPRAASAFADALRASAPPPKPAGRGAGRPNH